MTKAATLRGGASPPVSGTQNSLLVPAQSLFPGLAVRNTHISHSAGCVFLTRNLFPTPSHPPTGLLLSQTPSEYSIDVPPRTALKYGNHKKSNQFFKICSQPICVLKEWLAYCQAHQGRFYGTQENRGSQNITLETLKKHLLHHFILADTKMFFFIGLSHISEVFMLEFTFFIAPKETCYRNTI